MEAYERIEIVCVRGFWCNSWAFNDGHCDRSYRVTVYSYTTPRLLLQSTPPPPPSRISITTYSHAIVPLYPDDVRQKPTSCHQHLIHKPSNVRAFQSDIGLDLLSPPDELVPRHQDFVLPNSSTIIIIITMHALLPLNYA